MSATRYEDLDPAVWVSERKAQYSYLLGLYLGDGCLVFPPRGHSRIVLTLDDSYPMILHEAAGAVAAVAPDARLRAHRRPGCIGITAAHPDWVRLFPQHGPGRKHRRHIELSRWQSRLCADHPWPLLRGLIHSDGSRVINRFRVALPTNRIETYQYPRYFFTNYSADIRRIFCEHCELLGIRWTQSSFKNISVSHRDSVAKLDQFIGPKK